MRKGLHSPLVALPTWNPGHSGGEEKKLPRWDFQCGMGTLNVPGGGGSVRVGLTNYPCCFQAGIEIEMIHKTESQGEEAAETDGTL